MDKKQTGMLGERKAVFHLRLRGYKIISRNERIGHLECDIIASKKEYIVFCEVKTRHMDPNGDNPYGTPADAVDRTKAKHLLDFARLYLLAHPKYAEKTPRIDVIEIYAKKDSRRFKAERLNHIENALRRKM